MFTDARSVPLEHKRESIDDGITRATNILVRTMNPALDYYVDIPPPTCTTLDRKCFYGRLIGGVTVNITFRLPAGVATTAL